MRKSLVIAFLFTIKISCAADFTVRAVEDTTITKNEYKISRKEFLEKYGRDDSSRALINFYFSKRVPARILFFSVIWQIPIWPFPLASNLRVSQSKSGSISQGFGGLVGSVIFLCLLLATVGLATGALGQWVKYSRKRLLSQLNRYFNGQSIPKGISRSHLFRRVLKKGK
ncbi:MAG TPA: hypothetical protein VNV85_05795 [Puia sp.]|jgi:hypothetical protein|nr:hypothetical protein [Puia sp.]